VILEQVILSSEIDGGAHRLPFGDVLLEYLKLLKRLYFHMFIMVMVIPQI
jgi:hypothetical protein